MILNDDIDTNDLDLLSLSQITSPSSALSKTKILNDYRPLVSNEITAVFQIIFKAVLCTSICCVGVVSNIINMIVFKKLGFQETVNVSLFAMAVSDFAATLTLLWVGICANPLFENSGIPFIASEVLNVSGIWPHHMFVRITGWLTAVVALERCFCVIFPLKFKDMLTSGRIKAIVVLIFILVIASFVPSFYTMRMIWVFVPTKNRTMLGLGYTSNRAQIAGVASLVNSTVPSVLYFIITLVATIILVGSLKRKSKWRQKATAAVDKEQQVAVRDKRVVKLLIVVATIFIICLFPTMIVVIAYSLDPELSPIGKRKNLLRCVGSITLTIEAINSSVNIFVYYNMSSKYKEIFQQLFQKEEKDLNALRPL